MIRFSGFLVWGGSIIVQKWGFLYTLSTAKSPQLLSSRYAQVIVLAQWQMSHMSHMKKGCVLTQKFVSNDL